MKKSIFLSGLLVSVFFSNNTVSYELFEVSQPKTDFEKNIVEELKNNIRNIPSFYISASEQEDSFVYLDEIKGQEVVALISFADEESGKRILSNHFGLGVKTKLALVHLDEDGNSTTHPLSQEKSDNQEAIKRVINQVQAPKLAKLINSNTNSGNSVEGYESRVSLRADGINFILVLQVAYDRDSNRKEARLLTEGIGYENFFKRRVSTIGEYLDAEKFVNTEIITPAGILSTVPSLVLPSTLPSGLDSIENLSYQFWLDGVSSVNVVEFPANYRFSISPTLEEQSKIRVRDFYPRNSEGTYTYRNDTNFSFATTLGAGFPTIGLTAGITNSTTWNVEDYEMIVEANGNDLEWSIPLRVVNGKQYRGPGSNIGLNVVESTLNNTFTGAPDPSTVLTQDKWPDITRTFTPKFEYVIELVDKGVDSNAYTELDIEAAVDIVTEGYVHGNSTWRTAFHNPREVKVAEKVLVNWDFVK